MALGFSVSCGPGAVPPASDRLIGQYRDDFRFSVSCGLGAVPPASERLIGHSSGLWA